MLFSSPIFLLAFLPIFLALYFLVGKRYRNTLLLLASVFFYTWGEGKLVAVMLTSTVVDYFAGLVIAGGFKPWRKPIEALNPDEKRSRKQKIALTVSILINLSLLGFFKYFNFGLDNFNALMEFLGMPGAQMTSVMNIVLPLGISFYTFQSMSYTIDVFKGNATATRHFINFAAFVTMFPQLVAGPIVRYAQVAKQMVERVVTRAGFAYGIQRFIIGLGKKMLIANIVALPADKIFALPAADLTTPLAWLGVICYALQIYFDFSGYSDMAIGLGRMLGLKFLENFNYPYISQSIREFWRRWHISLSTWFRDYVYIPLGGNRKGPWRTYFYLLTVFFVTGLWHGAAWSFVIWGFLHGLFMMLERAGLEKLLKKSWRPIRHIYVLLVVLIGWVFFRAEDLGYSLSYLKAMAGFGGNTGIEEIGQFVDPRFILVVIVGIIGSMQILPFIKKLTEKTIQRYRERPAFVATVSLSAIKFIGLAIILFTSLMLMAHDTYNPFIYFRF